MRLLHTKVTFLKKKYMAVFFFFLDVLRGKLFSSIETPFSWLEGRGEAFIRATLLEAKKKKMENRIFQKKATIFSFSLVFFFSAHP